MPACGVRLRVAQQRLELRAAQRLDAAGLVDVLDRHQRALAALLARIGQRAGHRVQHADLHRLGLGTADERKRDCGRGRRRLAQEGASVDHARLLQIK